MKMKFEHDFFEEETLCEYRVSKKSKKIWAVQLDLLNELLRVCQKHGIKIVVFAGTFLGAVRHNGFIPWDDDIDVAMDRENYEKLLRIAPEEFEYPYFLQTGYNDQLFFLNYARFRNSDTTCIISWNRSDDYNNGIYIDVFVLDGFPDDKDKYDDYIKCKEKLERLISFYKYKDNCNIVKKVLKSGLRHLLQKVVSYDKLLDVYNAHLCKYSGTSNKIGLLTHPESFRKRYWLYKEELENIVYLDFETLMVPVPANYDEILKRTYGNYMEFPPVEKRGTWHEGYFEMDPDTPYKEYFKKLYENEENGK